MIAELLTLIVVLAIVGVVLWLVTTYLPMPEPYKRILIVVVALIVLLYAVRAIFGIGLPYVR